MRNWAKISVVSVLLIITTNVGILNRQVQKQAITNLETLATIEALAQHSYSNDLFLKGVVDKLDKTTFQSLVSQKNELDKLGLSTFRSLVKQNVDLRKVMDRKIQDFANIVPNIVQKVNPSIVGIEIPYWYQNPYTGEEKIVWGGGAGVVLDTEGHILTVAHITKRIENPDSTLPTSRIRTYNGRTYNILQAATSPKFTDYFLNGLDVGMIQIDPNVELPPVQLGSTLNLKYGQSVIVIGHPADSLYSVSTGVLSRIGTVAEGKEFLLEIDARINLGNSGGPVIGLDGLVYGLASFIYTPYQVGPGLNYFVPVHVLEEQIPILLKMLK